MWLPVALKGPIVIGVEGMEIAGPAEGIDVRDTLQFMVPLDIDAGVAPAAASTVEVAVPLTTLNPTEENASARALGRRSFV